MARLLVCQNHDCHNVFEPHQGQVYCSNKCRQKAWRDRNRSRSRYINGRPYYERWCRNCGTHFVTYVERREYCSNACKQQHYRDRNKLNGEA